MTRCLAFWGMGLCALLLFGASGAVRAQGRGPRSVVWVEHHSANDEVRHAREKALRLELQARDITLLGAVSAPPAEGQSEASLAENAAAVLGRTGPAAVLWLEGDPERPVSWLFVRRGDQQALDKQALGKAPLPHPPDAIDTQLFALAAASLLDQVLGEAVSVPTPAAVAAAAPIAPAAPVAPQPAIEPLAPPERFFVQLGIALPLVTVRAGMEASSKPNPAFVFDESVFAGETSYFFNDGSIYVPDADSFDDYANAELGIPPGVTPVAASCEADGIITLAGETPSRYCVRVSEPGVVFVPALRLGLGTWLTPELALTLVYQWHFTIEPEKPLGAHALALEAQLVVLGDRWSGASLALLGDFGVGRTETPVVEKGYGRGTVFDMTANALSGPLEAAAGFALRYAFTQRLGVVTSLRFGARFPETQLVTGLTSVLEWGF